MAKYLDKNHTHELIPSIEQTYNRLKKYEVHDETVLYLNLNLDNTTSPSVVLKTMLTGNIPGLIEIPKRLYFNNSEDFSDSEGSKYDYSKLDLSEDNLLHVNANSNNGLAFSIGKIVQKSVRDMFNNTEYFWKRIPDVFELLNFKDEFNRDEADTENFTNKVSLIVGSFDTPVRKSQEYLKTHFEFINTKTQEVKFYRLTFLIANG